VIHHEYVQKDLDNDFYFYQSPYKVIFIALEELSKIKVNKFRVAEAIENSPKEPETLDELDELWKEQEAFSGEASECNTCEDDASLN
jgi:nitrate reductase delta subunit